MNIDLRQHRALILALDKLYPLRNPDPSTPLDQIRYQSGQRNVVEHLQRVLLDQEHNSILVEREVLGNQHV